MNARDHERRLLSDVLSSDAHRMWREDLRTKCIAALGAPMERSLLADILSDDTFETFRDDLRAQLVGPPRSKPWAYASIIAAAAALVVALIMAVPPPTSPPPTSISKSPRRRIHVPAWIVASRPLRNVTQQRTTLVSIQSPTPIWQRSPTRSRMTYVGSSPTRPGPHRTRPLAIVNTPNRSNLPNGLSDEQLLAALPPCGLVKTGPNSQRLLFLDPRDELRLVHSR